MTRNLLLFHLNPILRRPLLLPTPLPLLLQSRWLTSREHPLTLHFLPQDLVLGGLPHLLRPITHLHLLVQLHHLTTTTLLRQRPLLRLDLINTALGCGFGGSLIALLGGSSLLGLLVVELLDVGDEFVDVVFA